LIGYGQIDLQRVQTPFDAKIVLVFQQKQISAFDQNALKSNRLTRNEAMFKFFFSFLLTVFEIGLRVIQLDIVDINLVAFCAHIYAFEAHVQCLDELTKMIFIKLQNKE
jgi:hypothetical protein